ncbi:MAG: hypothetical protein HRU11_04965 [Parvularculaceae bacterium]|nr:hypothetical protein [Parvularculaceae bacterium]
MTDMDNGDSAGLRALKAGEAARLDALRRIGEARGSTVLTYMTSFREGWGSAVLSEDIRILERHVAQARAEGCKKLDLFLSTWGGDATVPWSLHAMLRDYLPKAKIGVILPFESYSAGTGIALGCDEVVMGLSSVLGPVDTQASGYFWQPSPSGGGVSALHGFMQLLRDFDMRGKLDDTVMLDWLTRNSDPLMLGSVYRLFRENKRKIQKILESRQQPLSAKDNERLADYFLYDVGIHGQGIRRREARDAGLSYQTDLEQTGLENVVNGLFQLYADAMQLFTPFARPHPGGDGYGRDRGLNGEHVGDTPVVLIESLYETNAAFRGYGVQRAWSDQPGPAGAPAPVSQDGDGAGLDDQIRPEFQQPAMRLSWQATPRRQVPTMTRRSRKHRG